MTLLEYLIMIIFRVYGNLAISCNYLQQNSMDASYMNPESRPEIGKKICFFVQNAYSGLNGYFC